MVKSLLHKRLYSWAFYVHLIAIKLILFIMLLYQESFEKPQVYFGFLFSTLLKYLALPKTNRKFKLLILEHFYGRGPFQLSIPPSHEHWKIGFLNQIITNSLTKIIIIQSSMEILYLEIFYLTWSCFFSHCSLYNRWGIFARRAVSQALSHPTIQGIECTKRLISS